MTTICVVRIKKNKASEFEKALELNIGQHNTVSRIFDVFGNEIKEYIDIERFDKRRLVKTLDYFP